MTIYCQVCGTNKPKYSSVDQLCRIIIIIIIITTPYSTPLTPIRRHCSHTLLKTMFRSCAFELYIVGEKKYWNYYWSAAHQCILLDIGGYWLTGGRWECNGLVSNRATATSWCLKSLMLSIFHSVSGSVDVLRMPYVRGHFYALTSSFASAVPSALDGTYAAVHWSALFPAKCILRLYSYVWCIRSKACCVWSSGGYRSDKSRDPVDLGANGKTLYKSGV